jgi:hypothetical protein
MTQE